MSEEKKTLAAELKQKDRDLLQSAIDAVKAVKGWKPQQEPQKSGDSGQETYTIEDMLTLPAFKAGVLKITGLKECEKCHHVDKEEDGFCPECGENY